jgi:DTW domain-containing protein YfiP
VPGPLLKAFCPTCLFYLATCLCPLIPRVANATEILILRHASEVSRPSNTGRLAALALVRSRLLDHGCRGAPLELESLATPGTWLLFPGPTPERPRGQPKRLVVVDGTWAQARRMTRRLTALHGLPRFSLPPPVRSLPRFRRGAGPEAMSTLEAIVQALVVLEGEALTRPLEALLATAVARLRTRRSSFFANRPPADGGGSP